MKSKANNEKNMSRIINRVLIAAFLIFVVFIIFQVYRADQVRAAKQVEGRDKSPIQEQKNRDYGKSGFQKVVENEKYTLYADLTTGEIKVKESATGNVWYSNPVDREDDNIVAIKTSLSAQITVSCIDLVVDNLKEENNYVGSIQKGGMESELIENGVKFRFAFPTTGVIIPVEYTLNEEGLLVEIPVDEIEELWSERYIVESISLLPWFGAGGVEDEGYLFVPDGSGALIDFNNGKQRFQTYSAQVYGRNLTMGDQNTTVHEQAYMPVFGMKRNDQGFLGVITSGATNGSIHATTSRKLSMYNQVYTKAAVREYKFTTMEREGMTNPSHETDYTQPLLTGTNYAVQYFFLEKNQTDYSGMSSRYREYLISQNQMRDSVLASEKYAILDLYGAVSIEKFVMGVKRPVVTALTTYEDVCNIVKELKEQGVENLIINYIGALDGGLNNKMNSKVATESVLGSKREFEQMVEYLEEENVILFLETNPIDIYESGNGYSLNGDSVKSLYDGNAFRYRYTLDEQKEINDSRWRMLKPDLVPGFVKKFAQSAVSKGVKNIALTSIGSALYSDYVEGEGFTSRADAKQQWKEALEEAAGVADYLMVHGGNLYCAPYADIITDVPTSSSRYDMEDQSIPFYQMIFQGSNMLAVGAINASVDYHYSFLKAQELGCSLKYNLIGSNVTDLVGTEYNDMVSYSYEYWKNTIVEQYHMIQDGIKNVAGEVIVYHEQLEENLTRTIYESGATILVNYGEEAYNYNGHVIEGRSYLVVGGEAK